MSTTKSSGQGESFCPTCESSFETTQTSCPHDGTDLIVLHSRKDALLGKKLGGRFVVEEKLGSGGMGAVYRATQTSMGRDVAIKVIKPQNAEDHIMAKRFLREAKLASKLSHPNTISVLDFGQCEDGMLYLAMEFVKGRALSEILAKEGAFAIRRVGRIALQLCDALESAHKLSIIHRDLKPANIMILDDPPGRDLLKVLDFGLAKSLLGDGASTTITQSGVAMGTPLYMSPEAIRGEPGDERIDLYSIGVVIYELLAGHAPFTAENATELYRKHMSSPPPPLPKSVPRAIVLVVLRLLEKKPQDRYSSVAATRTALETAFSENQGDVSEPGASHTTHVDELATTQPTKLSNENAGLLSTATSDIPKGATGLPKIAYALVLAAAVALGVYLMSREGAEEKQNITAPVPATSTPALVPDTANAQQAATVYDAAPDATSEPDAGVVKKRSRHTGPKKTSANPPEGGITLPPHALPPE